MSQIFTDTPSPKAQSQAQGGVHVLELLLPMQIDHTEFDNLNDVAGDLLDGPAAGENWIIDLTQVE